MPRIARVVIPGCPHHGNQRQKVFFKDPDRKLYLELLRKYFLQFEVDMAGYSLMPDRTHKVLIPALPCSLAKGVRRLHNDFARWRQIQRKLT